MNDPELLKDLLTKAVSSLGVSYPLKSARLFHAWDEIVGEAVASRCTPFHFKDGVLVVTSDSQIWAAEFAYLAPKVIERINEHLAAKIVKEIRVRVGRLERGAKNP